MTLLRRMMKIMKWTIDSLLTNATAVEDAIRFVQQKSNLEIRDSIRQETQQENFEESAKSDYGEEDQGTGTQEVTVNEVF